METCGGRVVRREGLNVYVAMEGGRARAGGHAVGTSPTDSPVSTWLASEGRSPARHFSWQSVEEIKFEYIAKPYLPSMSEIS